MVDVETSYTSHRAVAEYLTQVCTSLFLFTLFSSYSVTYLTLDEH